MPGKNLFAAVNGCYVCYPGISLNLIQFSAVRQYLGGGTVFAGILRDNELKSRGCGRRGDVNKLSAALSRSALEPVNESMSSPRRSNSSFFEVAVRPFCFLM